MEIETVRVIPDQRNLASVAPVGVGTGLVVSQNSVFRQLPEPLARDADYSAMWFPFLVSVSDLAILRQLTTNAIQLFRTAIWHSLESCISFHTVVLRCRASIRMRKVANTDQLSRREQVRLPHQ